jgi:hypothetical protein
MGTHLQPLSTDRRLVSDLTGALETSRDMDCAEKRCECDRSSPEHRARAERGRAILEAMKKAK